MATIEILFRYLDAPVANGPEKWLAGMPLEAREVPHKGWSWIESLPPSIGGKAVRLIVTDGDLATIQSDIEAVYDAQDEMLSPRSKWIKFVNLSQPVRTELEDTGEFTTDFATYQAFLENVL